MTATEWALVAIVAIYIIAFGYQIVWRARQSPEQGTLNGLSLIGFVLVAGGAILAFTTDVWSDWLALAFILIGIAIEIFVWAARRRRRDE